MSYIAKGVCEEGEEWKERANGCSLKQREGCSVGLTRLPVVQIGERVRDRFAVRTLLEMLTGGPWGPISGEIVNNRD